MKILRSRTQKDILLRMLANAIIAYDAVSHFQDPKKTIDAYNHIIDNLAEASYDIGGMKAMNLVKKEFMDKVNKIGVKERGI